MKQIKIIINEGGVVSQVLVSPEIAENASVEVIDFCTDDPDEYEWAEERYEAIKIERAHGNLQVIY